ncbi:Shedu immune nuclease family protein [Mucilaginibacter sp. 3215]|uniref:Shedu immune nuclease family protein n=1 Tax=Mucilaginibacter sp. 3215 TaxID=3373912 RepID=UPI003D206883
MDEFTTQSTSAYSQKVLEPVVIEETSTTRRIFIAEINDKKTLTYETVSGTIIHQRKNLKDEWESIDSINLAGLKGGEGVKIKFDSKQIKKLFDGLTKLYAISKEGVKSGIQKFIVSNAEDSLLIPKERRVLITSLITKNYGEEVWNELVSSDPDLATRLSIARIHAKRKMSLDEFESNINMDKTESYWQEYFYQNQWIFGYGLNFKFLEVDTDQPNYGGINYKGKGNQKGDFLTHTKAESNFTVLVEIKKPNSDLLGKTKTGEGKRYRNGAWLLGSELLGGVLQLQANCKTWQRYSHYPENRQLIENRTYTINPKGILIIGCTNQLINSEQIESFENFRINLNGIEIITFDELLERAKFILDIDDKSQISDHTEDDRLPF